MLSNFHGKEGVDGSSPSEGLQKSPANRYVVLPIVARFSILRGYETGTFWDSRANAMSRDSALERAPRTDARPPARKVPANRRVGVAGADVTLTPSFAREGVGRGRCDSQRGQRRFWNEVGEHVTGGSAGGLRWFEWGTTDSHGPTRRLLQEGLGMINGSYCPHYDAEDQRRPIFHAALLDGSLEMGYASGNRVAIRFTPGGEVVDAVTSEPGGQAFKVFAVDGKIIEEKIPLSTPRGTRRQSVGVLLRSSPAESMRQRVRRVGRAQRFRP